MWEGLFPPGAAPDLATVKPEVRDKVLRGIVVEHLVYDEAIKEGVDKSESVQKQLDELRHKLVVRAFLEAKASDIGDKDLHAAYDDRVASMRDQKEVRARHILVPTKEQAIEAKKELTAGKSFADVAKQYSKDPGTASQGGDLGYFTRDKMVPEFANAAFAMKKGEISDPVKSPFGWHIIEVEDIRPVTVPTYNEAKDDLKSKLQEKKLDEYLKGMVKTADVKVYDAKGKEQPFSKDIKDDSGAKK
ncbi:MAG: peptidylprolyl isomerase [Alphaproteobacteria bacterium]